LKNKTKLKNESFFFLIYLYFENGWCLWSIAGDLFVLEVSDLISRNGYGVVATNAILVYKNIEFGIKIYEYKV
jgi:hypothetical protein